MKLWYEIKERSPLIQFRTKARQVNQIAKLVSYLSKNAPKYHLLKFSLFTLTPDIITHRMQEKRHKYMRTTRVNSGITFSHHGCRHVVITCFHTGNPFPHRKPIMGITALWVIIGLSRWRLPVVASSMRNRFKTIVSAIQGEKVEKKRPLPSTSSTKLEATSASCSRNAISFEISQSGNQNSLQPWVSLSLVKITRKWWYERLWHMVKSMGWVCFVCLKKEEVQIGWVPEKDQILYKKIEAPSLLPCKNYECKQEM